MAAKGYTTAAKVAAFLGQSFSSAQNTQCAAVIEQAEDYIDRRCGRAWLVGVQTDEAHYRPTCALYLRYPPLASATITVKARAGLGETEETLVADEDYEVENPEVGLVRLVYPGSYDRVRVTYTPTSTLPKTLEAAATELVALWMQPHLRPDTYGLDSYQLPDLAVRFARSHVQEDEPPSIKTALDLLSFPVFA